MKNFVRLTLSDGQKLYIHVDKIVFFRERLKDSKDSLVQLVSQAFPVKESPEEIEQLIKKAQG